MNHIYIYNYITLLKLSIALHGPGLPPHAAVRERGKPFWPCQADRNTERERVADRELDSWRVIPVVVAAVAGGKRQKSNYNFNMLCVQLSVRGSLAFNVEHELSSWCLEFVCGCVWRRVCVTAFWYILIWAHKMDFSSCLCVCVCVRLSLNGIYHILTVWQKRQRQQRQHTLSVWAHSGQMLVQLDSAVICLACQACIRNVIQYASASLAYWTAPSVARLDADHK